ncbi:hypothetical protein OSB04_001350 [Centaurea solstitialis]|uniref:Uncharacterized protein n=1 Tax=Centaurea solstitialis TaxID=347529 RepID=A0AA38WUD8_9ASTR|nr:hypothetical protein OSB04_001350 [Centaurea solstitialis]
MLLSSSTPLFNVVQRKKKKKKKEGKQNLPSFFNNIRKQFEDFTISAQKCHQLCLNCHAPPRFRTDFISSIQDHAPTFFLPNPNPIPRFIFEYLKHNLFAPCKSLLTVINSDQHAIKASNSRIKLAVKYTASASKSDNDILEKPYPNIEEYVNGEEIDEPVQVSVPKKSAKIHDFCFGIPYGGIVFSGGLVGFLFSRNPATLVTGGLYGGALLALSIYSLKVWRQGQSSLPFILGQAGIAAALLWKNIQTYSLTKKILPTGFNAIISVAMLCFYTYVVVSGGNPPPKKLKSAAAS